MQNICILLTTGFLYCFYGRYDRKHLAAFDQKAIIKRV